MTTTISNNGLPNLSLLSATQNKNSSSTTASTDTDSSTAVAPSDSVKLTDSAKALQDASRTSDSAPVDTRKVDAIRQSIASGTYQISASNIADGLLSLDQQIGGASSTTASSVGSGS